MKITKTFELIADAASKRSLLEECLLEQMRNIPLPPPGYHYEASAPIIRHTGDTWTWDVTFITKPDTSI